MFTNESLLLDCRHRRMRARSAWGHKPIKTYVPQAIPLPTEPTEQITEHDVLDSLKEKVQCGECNTWLPRHDMVAQFYGDYLCQDCDNAFKRYYDER